MTHFSNYGYSTGYGGKPGMSLAFEEEDQTYVPESMPAPEPYQDFATGPDTKRISRTHQSSPRPRTYQSQARTSQRPRYEQRSGYVPMNAWRREQGQYMNVRCAQGYHESGRSFGLCGICSAVLLFPIGLACLFLDSERRCRECGAILSNDSRRPYH
ncbi:hypothetical protein BJ165DRAFT_1522616 [Panaeolus papilionaceus]|nr:hypothetical protein BJ165DRAFT_1522616 [Panaeolus papilionaceus]